MNYTILITSVVTLVAAMIPVICGWISSDYKQRKSAYYKTVAWIEVLRTEVDHELNTLAELDETLRDPRRTFTKRFCVDLFRIAKQEIIFSPRTIRILPQITKLSVDLSHTNNTLDRYENLISVLFPVDNPPDALTADQQQTVAYRRKIIEACAAEIRRNLAILKNELDIEFVYLNRNEPKLLRLWSDS